MTKSLLAAAALIAGVLAAPVASAQDVIRIGAPLPLTGPLSPEAHEAAARLRPVGRDGQQGRRHQGRRQDA